MARGFTVTETIDKPAADVWAYLTDLNNHASQWMDGVEDMIQLTPGDIKPGTGFSFHSRGRMHQTEVTSFSESAAKNVIALTSKQGSVTATYVYTVAPNGENQTHLQLDATCECSGFLVLLSPLIAYMIKRADSGQLANLKQAILQKG